MNQHSKETYRTVRLILGDQLNRNHSWFQHVDQDVLYVIAELVQEVTYVKHHVQKVCAFFQAMQAFASELQQAGHDVLYLNLDDTTDTPDVVSLLMRLASCFEVTRIEYQRPDEHRLLHSLRSASIPGVSVAEHDSEHFILPFEEIPQWFEAGKAVRMEAFYRRLRRQHDILMESGEPYGGQWNYDAQNRKKIPSKALAEIPVPLTFTNDVKEVLDRIRRHAIVTIGVEKDFIGLPKDREESLALLTFFCDELLRRFGDYQDAMTDRSDFAWSLYHSRLSFSLNTKMLHPREVIQAALEAFRSRDDISIAQVEGFVRQILGWREFIRGIYWANMPGYDELNALNAKRALPNYFWTGDTRMNCVAKTVNQSLEYAYAHHIQRLMVTGLFGLLAGIEPDQMDGWYLGIYADALEWVELPNTRGMSQYADDGIVASKPYAASGNYINKMSDYCQGCHYNVKEKFSADACPFNSLYWDFMVRHRERFERNPRIGMIYRNWDRFDVNTQKLTRKRAADCLHRLENL
jgi:deoxyribodipyrimidine photolyase-related protein